MKTKPELMLFFSIMYYKIIQGKYYTFFSKSTIKKSYCVKIYQTEKKTAADVTIIVRINTIKAVNYFNNMTDYK